MRKIASTVSSRMGIAVVMAVIGCVLALAYTRLDLFIGNDGVYYVDAATSLAAGQGLIVNNLNWLEQQAYIPYTNWPPGLPLVTALPILSSLTPPAALLLVSLLSYAAVIVFASVIANDARGPLAAVIAATIVVAQPEMWALATTGFAELPFIAALLGLTYFLAHRPGDTLAWVVAAAIVAAAALYFRYAGYFLVLFFGIVFMLGESKTERWYIVKVGAIFVLLIIPLLIRNTIATGDLQGNTVADSHPIVDTLFDNFWMAGFGLLDLLVPERLIAILGGDRHGWTSAVIGSTLTIAVFGLCAWCFLAQRQRARSSAALLATMTASYLLFMIVLRTFKYFDPLTESRLVAPAFPCLAVVLGCWCARLIQSRQRVLRAGAVVAVGGYVAVAAYYVAYLGPAVAGFPSLDGAVAWVRQNLPAGACLVSEDEREEAFLMRTYLPQHRAISVPEGLLARSPDVEAVEAVAARVVEQSGCHYFVTLPRFADRRGSGLTLEGSSFVDVPAYRAILDDGYQGPARVLLNDERGIVVYFPGAEAAAPYPEDTTLTWDGAASRRAGSSPTADTAQ